MSSVGALTPAGSVLAYDAGGRRDARCAKSEAPSIGEEVELADEAALRTALARGERLAELIGLAGEGRS